MFAFDRCAASGPVDAPSSDWAMTGSFPANASDPLKPIGAAARWSRNVFAYQNSCAVENARFAVAVGGDRPGTARAAAEVELAACSPRPGRCRSGRSGTTSSAATGPRIE